MDIVYAHIRETVGLIVISGGVVAGVVAVFRQPKDEIGLRVAVGIPIVSVAAALALVGVADNSVWTLFGTILGFVLGESARRLGIKAGTDDPTAANQEAADK